MSPALLIAAGGDWMTVIVPAVFFVIWALNQLLAAKGNPPPKAPPRRGPEAERPLRPPGNQLPDNQAQLNAEIEQFLKRAGQKRSEQRSRREGASPSRPQQKPPKPRPVVREQPTNVEPLPPRELTTVEASVAKHLGSRSFQQRTEHLADDIVRADEQMEDHLQKAFGRRVGTLGDSTPKAAAPATDAQPMTQSDPVSAAAVLGRSLSQPENMRQALILNEILQRPTDRW